MFRPHRYLVITITLACVIAAGRYTLAASDAQIARLRSTSSDDDISQFTGLVAARGLAGGAMPDPRASVQIPLPVPGVGVSESIVTLSGTGEQVSKATTWKEPLGSGFLELQETTAAGGQTTVEYWVLTSDRRRCLLNGYARMARMGMIGNCAFGVRRRSRTMSFRAAYRPARFCSPSMQWSLVLPASST
jgi:hypothetical protein